MTGTYFVKHSPFFYWVVGIAITAIIVVTAFCLDDEVRDFIAQHQNQVVRKAMLNVSRFGDWPEHFVLGLILAGAAWLRGSKKWIRIFLSMLIALAIAGVVGHGIKIATGRARPSVRTEETWNRSHFSSKYHAFPSGHVAASMAFFGVLFFASRRIGLIWLPIPIVIGFSRMYVTAHYLSDVVYAAVLGILSALLVAHFLFRPIRNPRSAI